MGVSTGRLIIIIFLPDTYSMALPAMLFTLRIEQMNVLIRQLTVFVRPTSIVAGYGVLESRLLRASIFNFLLLSLIGLLLRAWHFTSIPYLSYKNVLHAHSHFAFGGWAMPALVLLVLKFFPELCGSENYRHWRNSISLMLLSAYGMLLSFPFQGYGAVSITFSTLSLVSGFYAGYIIYKPGRPRFRLTSYSFLQAGFFYFILSSLGPFATGPLIALGKAGTPIYYNVIYFFLHFQYNGFFTFVILAVLYRIIEHNKPFNNGKLVFRLMYFACMPTYLLSVLWTKPAIAFNITGGLAVLMQLMAAILLLKDIKGAGWKRDASGWLFHMAIFAFVLKNILQLLSAIPSVAQLAVERRNFIIAYLHLVLLGFVSVFVLACLLRAKMLVMERRTATGFVLVVFAFISTELLLVLQAAGWLQFLSFPYFLRLIFWLSVFFPAGLTCIYFARQRESFASALPDAN